MAGGWLQWPLNKGGRGSTQAARRRRSRSSTKPLPAVKAIVLGHANGAKCTESARPASTIVRKARTCKRSNPQCLEELGG